MIGRMILGIVVILLLLLLPLIIKKPSNNRNWALDQQILPTAEFNGDQVTVRNIRHFEYRAVDDYTPGYYDKTFDLNKIKKAWYVVEPFSPIVGPAHTFVTYEFEGDEFLSVSIEVRKEAGETFRYGPAFFRGYELMYVIADERDAIKLRSNYRKDKVFLYPIKSSVEDVRAVFVDMLKRANDLAAKPEFYNALTSTCTTNIVSHVNRVGSRHIPFSWKYLFPAYSDELAMEIDFLDTDLPLAEAREKFYINDLAEKYGADPEFSLRIRGR